MHIKKTKRITCFLMALVMLTMSLLPVAFAESEEGVLPTEEPVIIPNEDEQPQEEMSEPPSEEELVLPEEETPTVITETPPEPTETVNQLVEINDEPQAIVSLSLNEAIATNGYCYTRTLEAIRVFSLPDPNNENHVFTLPQSGSLVLVTSVEDMAEIWFANQDEECIHGYVDSSWLENVAIPSDELMENSHIMSNIAGNDLAVFMIPVEPFVTEP